jgi:hypothetical protein
MARPAACDGGGEVAGYARLLSQLYLARGLK